MNDYKQTDKYTWMLTRFSADFEIALNDPYKSDWIGLPYFKENMMYKGMEVGKHYSLKELGL